MTVEPEEILFPELPIVDAHIHLWDRTGFDYFAEEFLADAADGHNVQASVYVECNMHYSDDPRPAYQVLGETAFALAEAARAAGSEHKLNQGILFAADLMLGREVGPVLDAQLAAGQGRSVGTRFRVAYDDDLEAGYHEVGYQAGDVLGSPAITAAAEELAKRGLVLELWAFHTQLERVKAFALRFPDLQIVLDHVGGPLGVGRYAAIRDEVYFDWAQGITSLAEAPNVQVKLSGLGISRMGYSFAPDGHVTSSDQLVEAWGRYIRHCVAAFGADRCIFASNFPVDRRVTSYRHLLNGMKKILAHLPPEDLTAIFSGNARRTYRLA